MSMQRTVYHTQENRIRQLDRPVQATGKQQWFGEGYYFWEDEVFAHEWGCLGKCSEKRKSSKHVGYQVYQGKIEPSRLYDAAYNEEQRKAYIEAYHAAYEQVLRMEGGNAGRVTEGLVHARMQSYTTIRTKHTGIRYMDTPGGKAHRTGFSRSGFPFRDRVQLCLFEIESVLDFELKCVVNCSECENFALR